jgi:hypothetical protein
MTAAKSSASNGSAPISARLVLYSYVAAAAAALFDYSAKAAIMPAATATGRCTPHRNNQVGRKRFAACKLRLQLNSLPDVNEPLPPKSKWTRRRTYQRIRNEIQRLEAKTNARRFRKPLSP